MSRVGIEPTTRRLGGAPKSESIAADLGKAGSAFFTLRQSMPVAVAFYGKGCTPVARGAGHCESCTEVLASL